MGSKAVRISHEIPARTKGAIGMPKLFKIEEKMPRTNRNLGAIKIGSSIAKNPSDLTKFIANLWPMR